MKIAFVGLGNMGAAMARNLIEAGHSLTVWNRSLDSAKRLESAGAKVAGSPAEAARDVELLITMLADDAVTRDILFGDSKTADALPAGSIHVAMSTLSPAFSDELTMLHATRMQGYLAAPVFGRPEAAAAKTLSIVTSGSPETIERVRPVLEALGERVFVVGRDPSAAHTMKVAGNFLIATLIEALGEAFALSRKSGLDSKIVLEIVSTLFQSARITNYARSIVEEKFSPAGFRLALGLKDTRLTVAAADRKEVPMPLASLLKDRFLSGVAQGHGDMDWAFIARLIATEAGL